MGFLEFQSIYHAPITTVLIQFSNYLKNAINCWGLPSQVRSDKDGENVKVSMLMLSHPDCGSGRGSMITGKKRS